MTVNLARPEPGSLTDPLTLGRPESVRVSRFRSHGDLGTGSRPRLATEPEAIADLDPDPGI
jgi:hypothetical protein